MDPQLTVEYYTRTQEQDLQLGIQQVCEGCVMWKSECVHVGVCNATEYPSHCHRDTVLLLLTIHIPNPLLYTQMPFI